MRSNADDDNESSTVRNSTGPENDADEEPLVIFQTNLRRVERKQQAVGQTSGEYAEEQEYKSPQTPKTESLQESRWGWNRQYGITLAILILIVAMVVAIAIIYAPSPSADPPPSTKSPDRSETPTHSPVTISLEESTNEPSSSTFLFPSSTPSLSSTLSFPDPTSRPSTSAPTSMQLREEGCQTVTGCGTEGGEDFSFTSIVISATQRRLYAEKGLKGKFGVGANLFPSHFAAENEPVRDIEKWNFKQTPCSLDQQVETPACFFVENVGSGRRLYARMSSATLEAYGAVAPDYPDFGPPQIWYLQRDPTTDFYFLVNSSTNRYMIAIGNRDGLTGVGAAVEFQDWLRFKWTLPDMPQALIDAVQAT